ncbi:MAG: ABC transporter permease subunit [Lawsonibacter sp.]|nr:ABC transporter permease subunit [Lawsonibacter sp.]
MNIFFREMKANRRALIIWCTCMIVVVLSGMAKYTVYSSGEASSQVIQDLPQSVKALLGMGSLDVTTMSGFFALLFLYIAVAAAIHAAILGGGILAKEERDKTTEFLIVKPVSRSTIITSKLLAALVTITILNIVTLVASIGMVAQYNKEKDITGEIVVFFLSMCIIQLIFLSLGALLSAFMRNPKGAGSIVSSIVIAAYIISEITSFNDHLNILNVLSPFKYFSYNRIIEGNGLNPGISVLSIMLVAVFTASTYFFYEKRDLSV